MSVLTNEYVKGIGNISEGTEDKEEIMKIEITVYIWNETQKTVLIGTKPDVCSNLHYAMNWNTKRTCYKLEAPPGLKKKILF